MLHIAACVNVLYQLKFAVHDINKDTLEITVFDKDLFSPNGELPVIGVQLCHGSLVVQTS